MLEIYVYDIEVIKYKHWQCPCF